MLLFACFIVLIVNMLPVQTAGTAASQVERNTFNDGRSVNIRSLDGRLCSPTGSVHSIFQHPQFENDNVKDVSKYLKITYMHRFVHMRITKRVKVVT